MIKFRSGIPWCNENISRTMGRGGMPLLLYRRGGVRAHQGGWGAAMARRGWGTLRGWLPMFWRGWIRNLPKLKKDIVGRFGGGG